LGGDVGRQSLDAAQSWARLSHLVADGVPSGGVVPLLGGVLVGVRRFLKMSWQLLVAHAAAGHPSHWPPRFAVVLPPSTGLIVMRVSCMLLRLHAHLTGMLACRGLIMRVLPL
jgi:hypothetical protein